jgi:prevent-host-death family protein
MIATNYSTLRKNMKLLLDKVSDDYEVITVTRKNNKNVVIMSEEEYNNILENMHIVADKANYDWIMQSKSQLESGSITKQELIEDDENNE